MPKAITDFLGLSGESSQPTPTAAPENQGILTEVSIPNLSEFQLCQLVDNRWQEGESVYDVIAKSYSENTKAYKNKPDYINMLPAKRAKLRANRIFSDMEAVINALIANPPKPQFIPARDDPQAVSLAQAEEKYFNKKYSDLNLKEVLRKGLRNLYFGRLIVIKTFWDSTINDFNARALDPRKVRIPKNAVNEQAAEFVIEEVEDYVLSVCRRFPDQAQRIAAQMGYRDHNQLLIDNPMMTYQEAWVRDYVVFKFNNIIMGTIKNPYWDWDGLLVTPEENEALNQLGGEQRRIKMYEIRAQQDMRQAEAHEQQEIENNGDLPRGDFQDIKPNYSAYYFNHFDQPRKPYIWATAFNNENTPVGQTDMISQAAPLQEAIDRRKQDIDENSSLVNGQIKVDSTVMDKADAQKLRYEARGVIWGKGVVQGVQREMGTPLPAFVYQDMQDSRAEIDNIMAASSALRGEREGQETKAGRLALVDQSYMRLNEYVQIVDYVSYEMFNWFYQLAKVRYTEHHYAKDMGEQQAVQIISLIQDDFIQGAEVRVIAGKTLPEDREFKYAQAQVDLKEGFLSPVDYYTIAGYDNPQEKAKNAVVFKLNPSYAVGLTPEEMQQIAPPQQEDKPPSVSISFSDLPPDGQMQAAAKAGITLNPQILVAEKMAQQRHERSKTNLDNAEAGKPVKSPIQVKRNK